MVDCEGDCGNDVEEAVRRRRVTMQREVAVQMMDSWPCCEASSDAAAVACAA